MKSLAELAQVDRTNRLGDFAQLARAYALGKGSTANAIAFAKSERVREILQKDVVAPGGTFGADSWGEQLAETRLVLSSFTDSLRFSSAWAAAVAANLVWKVPLNSTVGLVASGTADAAVVGPADAAPVRRLDVSNANVARQKAVGLLVLTDEFMRDSPAEAESVISRELRASVAAGVDSAVITTLLAGVTAYTSSGSALSDARLLLQAVDLTPMSRPFWLCGIGASVLISTMNTDGVRHAPGIGPVSGGEFLSIPMFISPGIDTFTLALVDGSRVAGNLSEAELGLSRQALVAMDTAPTGGVAGSPISVTTLQQNALVSAFQENLHVLRCLQWFGATKLRPGAVASVSLAGSP
jgi:hypothetical protein